MQLMMNSRRATDAAGLESCGVKGLVIIPCIALRYPYFIFGSYFYPA